MDGYNISLVIPSAKKLKLSIFYFFLQASNLNSIECPPFYPHHYCINEKYYFT